MKKAIRNFEANFNSSELFGEIIFIEEGQTSYLLVNDIIGQVKPRVLAELNSEKPKKKKKAKTSNAVGTSSSNDDDDNNRIAYQIKAWFATLFGFAIFFVCYALFNMDNQKDTLLYAPFLTGDAR